MTLLWTLGRIGVGLVFAYAGASKLLEPAANFEAALLKYGIFSPVWIPWVVRILPWIEWIGGSFLILGYAPRQTGFVMSLLSLAFLVALGSSPLFLESGASDCGCFGSSGLHLSVRQIFFVDLASFVVTLRVAFLKRWRGTLHGFLVRKLQTE